MGEISEMDDDEWRPDLSSMVLLLGYRKRRWDEVSRLRLDHLLEALPRSRTLTIDFYPLPTVATRNP